MMPRQFSRFTGFLGSKVNYIMWWCFLKAMWKAVRGRLGFKKIVFKVNLHSHSLASASSASPPPPQSTLR